MTSNDRKEDQRARLLRAMIDLSAEAGYAQTSVAQIVAHARVSRSTFYEQFEDKRMCFGAAQRDLSERLLTRIERAARTARTEREASDAVLGVLVVFAEEDPSAARVLMNETLAAGKRAMDLRDELIAQIAGVLERAWDDATEESERRLDVPAQALVGGTFRLISIRILRGIGACTGSSRNSKIGPARTPEPVAHPTGGGWRPASMRARCRAPPTPTSPSLPRHSRCPRAGTG